MTFTREDFHADLGRVARKLTPVERRGLHILLAPPRLLAARVEERLDRGSPQLPHAAPADVWVVRAYDDDGSHAAYRSALRTLCGIRVRAGLRGRGQHGQPTCETCATVLEEHRDLVLVRGQEESCPATTKTGKPCQRSPGPSGYCPSHKRAA